MSFLQKRRRRHRKANKFDAGHTISKRRIQDSTDILT